MHFSSPPSTQLLKTVYDTLLTKCQLSAKVAPVDYLSKSNSMWFKRKTELEKQILEYGKDTDVLLEFAKTIEKSRIEDIGLEDIKDYYSALLKTTTPFTATHAMKILRRYFRMYRGPNILPATQINDNPLATVDRNVILQPMTEKIKRKKGQPRNEEGMKKVMLLREEGKLSFRQIARALNKDSRQVYKWYGYVMEDRKKAKRGQLSTG